FAAAREQGALAVLVQVGDRFAGFRVRDHRSHRHTQDDILGAPAVLLAAHAALAVLGAVNARVAVIDQRVDVAVGDGPDAAAAATVAAVGPAARNVLLAPEADGAIPALAGVDLDHGLVDELHRNKKALPRG